MNSSLNTALSISFTSLHPRMSPKNRKSCICRSWIGRFLLCDFTEKFLAWSRFCVFFHTVTMEIHENRFFVKLMLFSNFFFARCFHEIFAKNCGKTWIWSNLKKKSWKWLRNRFRRNLVSRNLSQIWKNFKSQGFKSRCVVLIFENHADYWLI